MCGFILGLFYTWVYVSLSMSVPMWFCNSVYILKSGIVVALALLFFAQDCFGCSGSFVFSYEFYHFLNSSVNNAVVILMGITLTL
jgi:hypothetical protein